MEVILLESFDKLGKIGDTVNVKDGFARNFLLPQKKPYGLMMKIKSTMKRSKRN